MIAPVDIPPLCLAWGIGAWEIALILLVVLILFGGKKLPELARGLAKGLKTFKSEMSDVRHSIEDIDEPADKQGGKEPDSDAKSSDA